MKRPPKKPAISVRAETFAKLREYARKHGTQVRTVVDDLILKALAEQEGGN